MKKKYPLSYIIGGIWSLLVLVPLAWVVFSSFKNNIEIFQDPWGLPSEVSLTNYESAWIGARMSDYFFNSVYVVFLALAVLLLIAAMASYALTRYDFKFRKTLLTVYIAGMAVPSLLVIIPIFSRLMTLNLVNTLPGLSLVYIAIWLPFTMFVLTGFFRSIPKEMEESAIIDGAGEVRLFFRIMLPLVQPGLICVGVLNFVSMWNEFMLAMIYMTSPRNRTLALGMYALRDSMTFTSNWGGLFAAIVIMLIPSMLIFLILQKFILRGLTLGAVKG